MDANKIPRVVIVGGGFGGLEAARQLRKAAVQVTLIDRRNFHLFQPLLYQVATAGLSPANIATPLRYIVRHQRNCEVLLADVIGFDVSRRVVLLADGEVSYDTLILAAGASHSYFGRDDWAEFAPGLKTLEQATEIRRRILTAFEEAEREADLEQRRALLTFTVIGGGPTGVELAGAISEIARHTLAHDFRHINPADARVVLVEAGPRVLAQFPEELSQRGAKKIRDLGIELLTGHKVVDIQADRVSLLSAEGTIELRTRTVLWGAGVQANPLARKLADAIGAKCDNAGRIPVQNDQSLAGHPELFVIGDISRALDAEGKPLPGLAPVAMQQGQYVARQIMARIQGSSPLPPFRYRNRGTMATIGRSAAVAQLGSWTFCGFLAWLMWLFVHLMLIVQFQNRLLVLMQWLWCYATHNRSARLITGDTVEPAKQV
jgi:NADH dehydrogenase